MNWQPTAYTLFGRRYRVVREKREVTWRSLVFENSSNRIIAESDSPTEELASAWGEAWFDKLEKGRK